MHAHDYKDEHTHVHAHAQANAFSQNGDMISEREGMLYSGWLLWMGCTSLKHKCMRSYPIMHVYTHKQNQHVHRVHVRVHVYVKYSCTVRNTSVFLFRDIDDLRSVLLSYQIPSQMLQTITVETNTS